MGLAALTTYSYTVAAYDTNGNTSAQSGSVNATTQKTIDTTPPTVSITSPANGATVSGTVTVSATASDNVGVTSVHSISDGANARQRYHDPSLSGSVEYNDGRERITHPDCQSA